MFENLLSKASKTNTINKILIIRFSSIGDIVLTTPIIRCLKKKYPNVIIHYLTKNNFMQILKANPYIDKIHTLSKQLNKTVQILNNEKFDCIVDLHNNLRSLRIKKALQIKSFSFPKLNIEKWIYVNLKINILSKDSIVHRYFEAVRPLSVQDDKMGLDYFIEPNQETTQKDIPMSHWNGYVACVIGGSYATKQFPAQKWKEFCIQCPFPIILLGGHEDKEMGDDIKLTDTIGKVYNACGKFNLNESADLVRKAKVVISNDTGLMHIAAAFQKPIISLWGNTSPLMGMYPYYGNNNLKHNISDKLVIIENNNLKCRPCSKIGYKECPKKHFKCMFDLDMPTILDHLKLFWKSN